MQIGLKTRVWAAAMAEPVPLWANRELRWLVSKRTGDWTASTLNAIPVLLENDAKH